jgi:integrase
MACMSYVQKHPKSGMYRVRRTIPVGARSAFGGKAVFLKSLGTKDHTEAKRLAHRELALLQDRIDRALIGVPFWERWDLDEWSSRFAGTYEPLEFSQRETVFVSRESFNSAFKKYAQKNLPDDLTSAELEEFRSYVESDHVDLYPDQNAKSQRLEPPKASTVPLSELESRLLKQTSYEARSVRDAQNAFGFLRQLYGDLPVDQIRAAHIRELVRLLLRYPTRRTAQVAELGLRGAAQREWQRTLTPKTVQKLISFISAGFKIAVGEELAETNPCQGIVYPKVTSTSRKTEVLDFRPADLQQLFGSPLFGSCQSQYRLGTPGNVHVRDHRYWVPLIAAYTGARLGEILQLERADVRQDRGLWYFSISDRTDGDHEKSLKTKQSRRDVPIHLELIRLGLLDYIRNRSGPLWDNRFKDRRTFGREFSKWFGRYLDEIGLTQAGLRFHSFRHSFKTAARMAGIPSELHDYMTGHLPSNVGGSYGEQKRLISALKEQIDRIEHAGMPKLNA